MRMLINLGQQPVHVSTDPRENGARVTWLIETEGNNFCYIQELIYEVEGVIDFRQPFQGYGLREFIISSLNPATEYRHRLCYSFQPPIVDTVCSEYISFLTSEYNKAFFSKLCERAM